jgi:hypothetical protein
VVCLLTGGVVAAKRRAAVALKKKNQQGLKPFCCRSTAVVCRRGGGGGRSTVNFDASNDGDGSRRVELYLNEFLSFSKKKSFQSPKLSCDLVESHYVNSEIVRLQLQLQPLLCSTVTMCGYTYKKVFFFSSQE